MRRNGIMPAHTYWTVVATRNYQDFCTGLKIGFHGQPNVSCGVEVSSAGSTEVIPKLLYTPKYHKTCQYRASTGPMLAASAQYWPGTGPL